MKMETVVPGVDLPLVRKSFSTVRMRPNFAVPLPHSSSTFPSFNHPPSSLLTCTDIQQIFQKVKLEPSFDIQNPTIHFFSPSLPSLNNNNRFNFSTSVYSRPLPPLFFLPLFRCRHKILEASN